MHLRVLEALERHTTLNWPVSHEQTQVVVVRGKNYSFSLKPKLLMRPIVHSDMKPRMLLRDGMALFDLGDDIFFLTLAGVLDE